MKEKNLKVIVLIGLPASGKSTWAKEFIRKNPDYIRISRDEFRLMLRNQQILEPKLESMINVLQETTILQALRKKMNVILDNTHLRESYINQIAKLVEYHADVEYMLFDASVKKCIERDSAREMKVGEGVLLKMDKEFSLLKDTFHFENQKMKATYLKPSMLPDFSSKLPPAVICDLDGTLAILGNRNQYDGSQCYKDEVNELILEQLKFHKSKGRDILIVSGRDESSRQITKEWLDLHEVPYDEIHMRKENDFRKDAVVKKEIYNNEIKNIFNVLCVYDDRLEVITAWHSLNLYVFCCNQGLVLY